MLRRAILLTLFMAADVATVCAQIADPQVGCYEVELGEWSPPLSPGADRYHVPPRRVHLTDSIGTQGRERGRMLVRPLIPHLVLQPTAYWQRMRPDSVSLRWSDGLAGVQLDLAAGPDSMHGQATAFTDVVGVRLPEAAAVLRRVSCDGS